MCQITIWLKILTELMDFSLQTFYFLRHFSQQKMFLVTGQAYPRSRRVYCCGNSQVESRIEAFEVTHRAQEDME